jgi:hypothetical protein
LAGKPDASDLEAIRLRNIRDHHLLFGGVGSLERYAKRETESWVKVIGGFLLILLLLFWPIAVVDDNIHSTVWRWVAGVPFELLWLAIVIAVWVGVQRSKKNAPTKKTTRPQAKPPAQITYVVQQPPSPPPVTTCKYCGATSGGRCEHCGAPI